jgi:hypothetical protein
LALLFCQALALVELGMAVEAKACDQVVVGLDRSASAASPVGMRSYYGPVIHTTILARDFPSVAQQSG